MNLAETTEFAVLRDAAGTRHVPAGSDARIASLVPSITELVGDLGLAERLVGRRLCYLAEYAVERQGRKH